MSDFKESIHDLLIVLLCIAVLMVSVYFQKSQEWNRTLEARDQKISELDQKIAEDQQSLASAQDAIASHKASSQSDAKKIQTAMQLIGELESRNQKDEKEMAALQSVLKDKDNEIAKINTTLSTMKESTGKDIAASQARAAELEKTVADQTRQLTEAQTTIQGLEASEKQMQEKLQEADKAPADQNENFQKLSDEPDALKEDN
jgi:chromosome segregation ATPase